MAFKFSATNTMTGPVTRNVCIWRCMLLLSRPADNRGNQHGAVLRQHLPGVPQLPARLGWSGRRGRIRWRRACTSIYFTRPVNSRRRSASWIRHTHIAWTRWFCYCYCPFRNGWCVPTTKKDVRICAGCTRSLVSTAPMVPVGFVCLDRLTWTQQEAIKPCRFLVLPSLPWQVNHSIEVKNSMGDWTTESCLDYSLTSLVIRVNCVLLLAQWWIQ